jgi:formylglycine-generating enzyme required for sulfatase activity
MLDTLAPATPTKLRRYQPRPGMVWIKGGQFRMGSDRHEPEEAPVRTVSVDGFWIDAMPVTNRQFSRFVQATDWLTTAERGADALERPIGPGGAPGPASLVFQPPAAGEGGDGWSFVSGADWRHPMGPESSLHGLEDHPVVHLSWDDISAYLAWSRTDLPTEAEWEFAARGGLDAATYSWGEELDPDGRRMANIWRGEFPHEHRIEAGWERTSPVGSYPPNGYGLSDMIGNVWEWTRDWWSTRSGAVSEIRCCSNKSRSGGWEGLSDDPALAHLKVPRRVVKGGSYLCSPSFCSRFRPAARQPMAVDTSACHVGFRCVVRPSMTR